MQDNVYKETSIQKDTVHLDSNGKLMEDEQLYLHFNIKALLDILSQDRKSLINLIPIAQKSIPKMIAFFANGMLIRKQ